MMIKCYLCKELTILKRIIKCNRCFKKFCYNCLNDYYDGFKLLILCNNCFKITKIKELKQLNDTDIISY
jgi:hypothetical protein